jgi:hypothetical protein
LIDEHPRNPSLAIPPPLAVSDLKSIMTRLNLILMIVFTTNIAFGQQNKIVGYYRSNYAQLDFFVTQIELLNDSTFKYVFSGDLFYDRVNGKYKISSDTIYFYYLPEQLDTTTYTYIDSTGKAFKLKIPPTPNYVAHLRPSKLYYKNRKLFSIKPNEQASIKNDDPVNHTRKYYLIRRKAHILDER